MTVSSQQDLVAAHRVHLDTFAPKRILMVVANPATSTTLGWPVGFWAAELAHPYYEFTEFGHEVTVASPNGGKVEVDALSDPRDPSKWSIDDILSLGFLTSPLTASLHSLSAAANRRCLRFAITPDCGMPSVRFTNPTA